MATGGVRCLPQAKPNLEEVASFRARDAGMTDDPGSQCNVKTVVIELFHLFLCDGAPRIASFQNGDAHTRSYVK